MGMRRSPAPLHMPMPFPLRGKAWILKSNQMKSEVFSLRLLLCEPSVELGLLLFDDHIDAGVLELLVELREGGLRIERAADKRLVVLVDDVRAGCNFVRGLRGVKGEAERSGLLDSLLKSRVASQ